MAFTEGGSRLESWRMEARVFSMDCFEGWKDPELESDSRSLEEESRPFFMELFFLRVAVLEVIVWVPRRILSLLIDPFRWTSAITSSPETVAGSLTSFAEAVFSKNERFQTFLKGQSAELPPYSRMNPEFKDMQFLGESNPPQPCKRLVTAVVYYRICVAKPIGAKIELLPHHTLRRYGVIQSKRMHSKL